MTHKHIVRVITHWALLTHIYISMAGFALAFLFGATGLTLNHQDFGLSEPRIQTSVIAMDKDLVNNSDSAGVEEYLREKLQIRSPSTDVHEDSDQIQMTFAAPGGRTVVTINRADGKAEVEKESRGWLGRLDDLHKGFDTGRVWYWTIDLAAIILMISSLTGMVTLVSLRARRGTGFALCALGILTVLAIYFIWVPR